MNWDLVTAMHWLRCYKDLIWFWHKDNCIKCRVRIVICWQGLVMLWLDKTNGWYRDLCVRPLVALLMAIEFSRCPERTLVIFYFVNWGEYKIGWIFSLGTIGSIISGRIGANFDEFRLGVKAISKYWHSIYKIPIFYSQDMGSYTTPMLVKWSYQKG
jgi:hypothetical protein